MSQRSLKASDRGQQTAKYAMQRKGWTQSYLAIEAGLSTRNSVWKFLSGRPVDRNIFMELCFQLDLEWQEIADLSVPEFDEVAWETAAIANNSNNSIEFVELITPVESIELVESVIAAVPEVLTFTQIKSQLNARFLTHDAVVTSPFNFTQQFQLQDIYIIPHHLPHLSSQQWLEVSDLESNPLAIASSTTSDTTSISILTTLQHYPKLLVLGKSGAGKSWLLKFLAQQCFNETLFADRIPLYLSLQDLRFYIQHHPDWLIRDFIGDRLGSLINQSGKSNILDTLNFDLFERLLLLIDGLDEIPYEQRDRILNQMRGLLNDNPSLNVVLTSRITPHTPLFSGVKIVELADFSWLQIQNYVHQRFANLSDPETPSLSHNQQNKAEIFLELLRRPEHQLILNLAKTPILLELLCCTFQERLNFPQKPTKLYQEGLEILLRRSQQTQHFQADSFYRELPLAEKFKLLGTLAIALLRQGHFYAEKSDLITIIYQFLQENFGDRLAGEDLLFKSEAILQGIQLQHGLLVEQAKNIFSFSHLTFQEYLAARYLVNSLTAINQDAQLLAIAERIHDPRWQEVIRLTLALLPNADGLFKQLKQQIDQPVWGDLALAPSLSMACQQAAAQTSPYPAAAVRAFYFGLVFVRDLNLVSVIAPGMVDNLSPAMALDLYLVRLHEQIATFAADPQADTLINLALAFDLENRFSLSPALQSGLTALRQNLVTALQGSDPIPHWWQTHGGPWQATLTHLLATERQLPLGITLNPTQRQALQQYYAHNLFLLQCLNGDCRVTPTVKDQLISDILTPSILAST